MIFKSRVTWVVRIFSVSHQFLPRAVNRIAAALKGRSNVLAAYYTMRVVDIIFSFATKQRTLSFLFATLLDMQRPVPCGRLLVPSY